MLRTLCVLVLCVVASLCFEDNSPEVKCKTAYESMRSSADHKDAWKICKAAKKSESASPVPPLYLGLLGEKLQKKDVCANFSGAYEKLRVLPNIRKSYGDIAGVIWSRHVSCLDGQGRHDEAMDVAKTAIESNSPHEEVAMYLLHNLGEKSDHQSVVHFGELALSKGLRSHGIKNHLANSYASVGRHLESADLFIELSHVKSDNQWAYINAVVGNFHEAKKPQKAILFLEDILAEFTHLRNDANVFALLSRVYSTGGRLQDSVEAIRTVVDMTNGPSDESDQMLFQAFVEFNRVNSSGPESLDLLRSMKSKLQLETYGHLLAVHAKMKKDLSKSGREKLNAVELLEEAHSLTRHNVHILRELVYLYLELGLADRAKEAIDNMDPAYLESTDYYNAALGVSQQGPRGLPDAVKYYAKALELDPKNFKAFNNIASSLNSMEKFEDACEYFDRVDEFENEPLEYKASIYINHIIALNRMAGFEKRPGVVKKLLRFLRSKNVSDQFDITPAHILEFDLDDDEVVPLMKKYSTGLIAKVPERLQLQDYATTFKRGARINLGYVHGMGFGQGPTTSRFLRDGFALHDRDVFSVLCFGFARPDGSPTFVHISSSCDQFFDLSTMDRFNAANLINSQRTHLLLDITGHTVNARMEVIAMQPAPLQIHYHAYPGSLQFSTVNALVIDALSSPPEYSNLYSEKLYYMPEFYLMNSHRSHRREHISYNGPEVDLAQYGLKGIDRNSVVLCSFNQLYKISYEQFQVWMNILKRTKNSYLWLLSWSKDGVKNLRATAKDLGVHPDRIRFTKRIDESMEFIVKKRADIFLDTPRFNAHTTGVDALWCNVPIVTMMGSKQLATRVAASLVRAVGMPEMIVRSPYEYEDLVVRLTQDAPALSRLKEKLARGLDSGSLYDVPRFMRNFDHMLKLSWETFVQSSGPAFGHIAVSENTRLD